eukprot:TRINITY_DN20958_c0_g1_i1.p1 TRINITY_DN20958_c0_g1~~TRINITY_DN20958_c0_g1_i1.p1  ORF type:complete len:516 (+),score=98.97 TRINITY_DN20958_c0_g1_i1:44-1591(+)
MAWLNRPLPLGQLVFFALSACANPFDDAYSECSAESCEGLELRQLRSHYSVLVQDVQDEADENEEEEFFDAYDDFTDDDEYFSEDKESSTNMATQECTGPSWKGFLGSKTPYQFQRHVAGKPVEAEAVDGVLLQSFFLSRHCTRYPTNSKDIKLLKKLFSRIDAPTQTQWLDEMSSELAGKYGLCTSCGMEEEKNVGRRFKDRFLKGRNLKVKWSATYKERTQQTAWAWRSGLEQEDPSVKFVNFTPRVASCESDLMEYSETLFFRTCDGYQSFKTGRMKAPLNRWEKTNGTLKSIGESILKRMGSNATLGGKHLRKLASSTYNLCATEVDAGLYATQPRWCTLLNETDAVVLSHRDYLKQCSASGPCSDSIAYKDACPLVWRLRSFLQQAQTSPLPSSTNELPEVHVTAIFAHAETVVPFLTALGFYTHAENFRTPNMAINLRVDVLRHKSGELQVLTRVNELPVQWPSCNSTTCLLEEVLNLTHLSCDRREFESICGKVACPAKKPEKGKKQK